MNILFLGSLCSPNVYSFCMKNKIKLDYPGLALQEALLKGLSNYCSIQTVSNVLLPSDKIKFIHKEIYKSKYAEYNLSVPTINIKGVKQILSPFITNLLLKKNLVIPDVIFVYALSSELLKVAKTIKNKNNKCKVVLMIPDLSEFMGGNQSKFYTILKSVESKLVRRYIDVVDGFILLARDMKERMPIGETPYIVLEGIYNSEDVQINADKEEFKTVMYTGNLGERYGIKKLVDAFGQIKAKDYRLWIRGNGDTIDYLRKIQKKDNRIKIFEPLTREELLKMEKKATVLVNPVSPKQQFTKYFFPSKTMEYLASGTPTIMYKLSCLPKDYHKYLYFFEEDSQEGIKSKIEEICSKPTDELEKFGKEASIFIHKFKTPKVQARRILDFIETL